MSEQVSSTRRVLVVDDARIIRNILRALITKMGLKVVGEAVNGAEAIRMYEELRPDLVTMDITMPVVDGLTATKTILKQYPEANIIMVTSVGQESVMKEAILSGAKDFIVKPFNEDRIMSAIRRVLQVQDLQMAAARR
ncbi:MAG: response regulator [Candidatus Riflebacteria bacterium]|nr:response regulator [Candidatus Riflebacteria bacterium]